MWWPAVKPPSSVIGSPSPTSEHQSRTLPVSTMPPGSSSLGGGSETMSSAIATARVSPIRPGCSSEYELAVIPRLSRAHRELEQDALRGLLVDDRRQLGGQALLAPPDDLPADLGNNRGVAVDRHVGLQHRAADLVEALARVE